MSVEALKTILSKQEKNWLLNRTFVRLTDHKEVQIYPMGAERYLSAVLLGKKKAQYKIKDHIIHKHVLVIPGFGTSAFLLAQAGAQSVTVYDKDPVTIAWIKSFKRYYHYREERSAPSIGELLSALTCWYPQYLRLPKGYYKNLLCFLIHPQALRRIYIFYMIHLVQKAIKADIGFDFELAQKIQFYVGDETAVLKKKQHQSFDIAFVPYLLGVKNGIETEQAIVSFMKKMITIVPNGPIIVNPSRNTREFYVFGQRYFTTTAYSSIQSIPGLDILFSEEDRHWFGTQGLSVFTATSV